MVVAKNNVKTTKTGTWIRRRPPTPAGQGPIQTAENKYNTSGDKDYVQQHGSGF